MATPNPLRAEAWKWLDENPDASGADVAREFDVAPSTCRRWHRQWRAKREGAEKKKRRRRTSHARTVVPADELAEEDRNRVLGIVRDTHVTIATTVERIRTAVQDAEGIPALDRDTSLALLNLQKTAASIIDTFPGLLELANGKEASDGASEADVGAILETLGVKPGES